MCIYCLQLRRFLCRYRRLNSEGNENMGGYLLLRVYVEFFFTIILLDCRIFVNIKNKSR